MPLEAFWKLSEIPWGLIKVQSAGLSTMLLMHSLQRKIRFIKWPNHEEILKSKQNFFSRGGFPGVIGCIDGTHVRIQAPFEDEAVYVNRKGFHSINVQAICDHEGTYYNIVYIYYLITN